MIFVLKIVFTIILSFKMVLTENNLRDIWKTN